MNRILVPIDFSENSLKALDYATYLAKMLNSGLILHHSLTTAAAPGANFYAYKKVLDEKRASRKAQLQELNDKIAKEGIHIEFTISDGTPEDEIPRIAKKYDVTFIVMGTKGTSGVLENFMGSVAGSITQNALQPVLAIPAHAKVDHIGKIVYATGLVPEDYQLIDMLLEFGKELKVPVEVIHVNTDITTYVEEHDALAQLQAHYASLSNKQLSFQHLIKEEGEALYEALNAYLDADQHPLLVMLTHKRNFIEKFFHHSQTKHMAFHTSVPLLVIKKGNHKGAVMS